MGAVIRNEDSLHGKRVKLNRGGKEVNGVMVAKDMRNHAGEYSFRWADVNGATCINDITEEEIDEIKESMKPTDESKKE